MAQSKIHSTVPVISTDNISKSLTYYQEVLGFAFDFQYGEPPVYAGVNAGDAEIYFTYNPEHARIVREQALGPDIFIWVTNADHFFKVHERNGAEITEPISDRPWGARQYVVKELNGYNLKFAQPL